MNKFKSFWKSCWEDKYKLAFLILLVFCFCYSFIGSFDAGMSGDDDIHNVHAERVYNFYTTFGRDTSALEMNSRYNVASYGQLVDNVAYAISRIFSIEDVMQVRHTTNAVCGWVAVLFAGLLAYRIGGRKWLPAIFASLLLFFSPRFLGHSFNNLKDVSLTTAILMGVYYIVVFCQDFPKVKKSTLVMLAVSIGLAIAVRIGGLLLIAYMGLFFLVFFIKEYGFKGIYSGENSRLFLKMLKWGIFVALGGYALGMLLWPYGLVSPIKHPYQVFAYMSQFAIGIRQLFEGSLQMSDQLPWYYTVKWVFMTIPVAVMIGALIYLFTGWKKERGFYTFLLLFCFVFPVFWITYTRANVYGGWRHSMFSYPTLAVMAGLGFSSLVDLVKKPVLKYVCMGIPVLLLLDPILHCFKNHPYEYVYFNPLAGGIEKAYGNYEMDYYYHSTREAAEWVMAHADTSALEPGEKINVATFHITSVAYYLKKDTAHFKASFSRIYDMGNRDWDYGIFTITGMNPEWLKNPRVFPPKNCVHTIKVDGVPICIVLKREDRNDFYGYQAKNRKQYDSAVYFYKQALDYNPYNEQALENLGEIYQIQGKPDSSKICYETWYEQVPTNISALYSLVNVNFYQGNYPEVLRLASAFKGIKGSEYYAHWFAANVYAQAGNLQFAMNELQALVQQYPFRPAYEMMASIYQAVGENEAARRCRNIASRLGY